jgi:putative polyhydroxyalkanoate system protein
MADIELHRIHNLGLAAARAAAVRMEADLGRKFGLKGAWQGNVLHFERPGVSGSLTISAEDLRISVALGFLMKAMKASIENAVARELDTLFPAKGATLSPPAPKADREVPKSKKALPPRKKGG